MNVLSRILGIPLFLHFLLLPMVVLSAEDFQNRLVGKWSGQATLTPLGPRPYNIDFQFDAEGILKGAANPGASIHHWWFYTDEGRLTLRFLSTFADNQTPTYLYGTQIDPATYRFHAEHPDFLSLTMKLRPTQIAVDIFHHDNPHVSIRLER